MHAIRFRIDGPSYRQEVAQQRANKRSQSCTERKKRKV
jgi:hypothetical protein